MLLALNFLRINTQIKHKYLYCDEGSLSMGMFNLKLEIQDFFLKRFNK